MPVTDVEQLIRQAVVTIAEANAGLQAVMGRASGIIIEKSQAVPDVPLPILAYDLETFDEGSGRAQLALSACADEPEGSVKCRAILEAAAAAFTWAAFSAQGLEIVPLPQVRASVDVDPERRLSLTLGQPNLAQADSVIPLLLTESL